MRKILPILAPLIFLITIFYTSAKLDINTMSYFEHFLIPISWMLSWILAYYLGLVAGFKIGKELFKE